MHSGFVRRCRVGSGYRRSEGLRCLSTSRSVCHCLGSLSLGLSLASCLSLAEQPCLGSSQRGASACSGARTNPCGLRLTPTAREGRSAAPRLPLHEQQRRPGREQAYRGRCPPPSPKTGRQPRGHETENGWPSATLLVEAPPIGQLTGVATAVRGRRQHRAVTLAAAK